MWQNNNQKLKIIFSTLLFMTYFNSTTARVVMFLYAKDYVTVKEYFVTKLYYIRVYLKRYINVLLSISL